MPISSPTKLTLLVAVSLLALSSCQKEKQPQGKGPGGPPLVPVSVAKATRESVPTELRVVGTVEASAIVQIKSQVTGPLARVAFTEGQNVNKGEVLFQIDPRPFEDAVRQAEAAISRDRAQINQLQATLARDNAQARFNDSEAARYAELLKAGVVSKSQSDQMKTSADVTHESANASQAGIESARAALDSDVTALSMARLNLSYTEIRAPLSGRAGNLLVHAGNLVKANDIPLVVIHQLTPIFVNFNIPEQHLAAVRRISANRTLTVTVYPQDSPGNAAPGIGALAGGTTGSLAVIDNTVDTATGTIHLKGTFPNANGKLWPGQFVSAVLTLDTISGATVVPAEAVQPGPKGQYVYVVKPDNKVEMRVVTVGTAFGKKFVIDAGLAPGETVVTDGHLRLFPGAQVELVDPAKLDAGKS